MPLATAGSALGTVLLLGLGQSMTLAKVVGAIWSSLFKSVDLPQPLGPRMVTNSRGASIETPFRMSAPLP